MLNNIWVNYLYKLEKININICYFWFSYSFSNVNTNTFVDSPNMLFQFSSDSVWSRVWFGDYYFCSDIDVIRKHLRMNQ